MLRLSKLACLLAFAIATGANTTTGPTSTTAVPMGTPAPGIATGPRQEDKDEWSIKETDIVLTAIVIFCELYVCVSIMTWRGRTDTFKLGIDGNCTICGNTEENHLQIPLHGNERCCVLADAPGGETRLSIGNDRNYSWWLVLASRLSFPVSVGGSIGKWYPPTIGYIGCSSVRCEKVVHNAVMSLVCVPFDLVDAFYLHKKAHREPIPTRPNLCAKIVQVLASLGYLIFDTVNQDAPGPWSTALVAVACLFDILLIGLESHALYKTMTRVEVDVYDGPSSQLKNLRATASQVTKIRGGRIGRVTEKVQVTIETEQQGSGFVHDATVSGRSLEITGARKLVSYSFD